jgi:hypothetical protein
MGVCANIIFCPSSAITDGCPWRTPHWGQHWGSVHFLSKWPCPNPEAKGQLRRHKKSRLLAGIMFGDHVWGQCAFYFKMALFKSRGKVATAPS